MVNLSAPLAARLSPTLGKKAEDLMTSQRYGRKAIHEKNVPFIERLPLSLNHLVSNGSSQKGQKACMDDLMSVIACLGKFDQNQAMCGAEVAAFNKCYMGFKSAEAKKKAFLESGSLPLGPQAKMTGTQMNQYMNKFPQSARKGVHHPNSVYKPGSRDRS